MWFVLLVFNHSPKSKTRGVKTSQPCCQLGNLWFLTIFPNFVFISLLSCQWIRHNVIAFCWWLLSFADGWTLWFAGATTENLPAGVLYRVKATYKYNREDVDELSFEIGDSIRVVEYEDPEEQVGCPLH
jgi:hypothetical protein